MMEAITDRSQREFCWMGNKYSDPCNSRNWHPRGVPRCGDRIRIIIVGSELPDSLARFVDWETA